MTVTVPDSVTAEGNSKVVVAPSGLASRVAPSAAILNGATSVDISAHLLAGWGGITGEQSTGESRRFSSKKTYPQLGRVAESVAPLVYTHLPQEDDSFAGNEAREALLEDNEVILVVGVGVDPDDDFAAGDVVRSVKVTCGYQNWDVAASDEFSPLTITQSVSTDDDVVTGECAV